MKFFMLLFFVSLNASAYTVFFKCDAEGRLSDQLTPSEMSQKINEMFRSLQAASPTDRRQQIESLCQGGALCMQELNQLLQMAEVSQNVSEEIIRGEIARVTGRAEASATELGGLVPVPEGLFQSAAEYQSAIQNIALARECRIASTDIPGKFFKSPEKDGETNCVLAHFQHSPYMYPSGVRISGTQNLTGNRVDDQPTCTDIDDIIKTAVVTDHDPYAALAISLMENGSSIGGLTLDPIGVVQTMGCPTTRATEASHNLNSFDTFYNVRWGTYSSPSLVNNIRDFAKVQNYDLTAGESFLCYQGEKFGVESAPKKGNACCTRLPYKKEDVEFLDNEKLLTYTSFDNYLQRPLEPNIAHRDPLEQMARRLQRFNGYSDSMGGAEGVPAWRSGVNFYQTPAYGYQAMDFILNTFWNNPYVREKVKELEKTLGKNSKSVICQGQPAGVYSVEHDLFFQKHANAPRMTSIRNRWNAARSFQALPKRDRNVLQGEFFAICEASPPPARFCAPLKPAMQTKKRIEESAKAVIMKYSELFKKDTVEMESEDLVKRFVAELKALGETMKREIHREFAKVNTNTLMATYWQDIYPSRRTVAMANRQDQGFSWGEMNADQFKTYLTQTRDRDINQLSPELRAQALMEALEEQKGQAGEEAETETTVDDAN